MGIPVIVMGDVIREAVRQAGLLPTDANMGMTANRLRAEGGMAAIARLCIPVIERQQAPLVLVDGIRGDAEVQVFREHFSDFVLVGISSDFENRLNRLGTRGRSDDKGSPEALRCRDERELGWGLGNALKIADISIANNGNLADYASRVRALIDELRLKK
jgi:dephospho-CoA kinase